MSTHFSSGWYNSTRGPGDYERGGALLYTTIGMAILASILFIVPDALRRFAGVSSEFSALISNKMVLHGIVDYIESGIRDRWCFSSNLDRVANCNTTFNNSGIPDSLSHNGSIERMLINENTLNWLVDHQVITANQAQNVPLLEITGQFSLGSVAETHPLFPLINSLRLAALSALGGSSSSPVNNLVVYYSIQKNESETLPRPGGQVYLKIRVELRKNDTVIKAKGETFRLTAEVAVFPREVGSFALMVENNLYLNGSGSGVGGGNNSGGLGDVVLPMYSSAREFDGRTGLIFHSPVFVNGHLNLPPQPNPTATEFKYSPVRFKDVVVLGAQDNNTLSQVRSGEFGQEQPFQPMSAGGRGAESWNRLKTVGGFAKGIQFDSTRDLGLHCLAQTGAPNSPGCNLPNDDWMKKCIDLNAVLTNHTRTQNSKLAVKLNSTQSQGPTNRFLYTIGLARGDGARELPNMILSPHQRWPNMTTDLSNAPSTPKVLETANITRVPQLTDTAQQGAATLLVEVVYLDRIVKATLSSSGKLTVYPRPEAGGNEPEIIIETSPVSLGGNIQPQYLDLAITLRNKDSLVQNNQRMPFFVRIEPFDVGYNKRGKNKRKPSISDLSGYLSFAPNSGQYQGSNGFSATPSITPAGVRNYPWPANADYGNLIQRCEPFGDTHGGFQNVSWSHSFAPVARHSWNFAEPQIGRFEFDKASITTGSGKLIFMVRSIIGECVIKNDVDLISGFFNCDRLIIEARTKKLKIIGTFIVGKMIIARSAFENGIEWMSIYHPNATNELRADGVEILKTGENTKCVDLDRNLPIWHPKPSINAISDLFTCNTISLRAKADPFTWTAVDPDCGLEPNDSVATTCKRHLLKFYVVELSRGGGV